MLKRKRYFGARRQWPDSPFQQVEQAKRDLKPLKFDGDWMERMYAQLQAQEFDVMAASFFGGHSGTEFTKLNGGFPLGTYFTTAGYNSKTHMICWDFESDVHRLGRLEAQAHIWPEPLRLIEPPKTFRNQVRPYHDFDKILMEPPYVDLHPTTR